VTRKRQTTNSYGPFILIGVGAVLLFVLAILLIGNATGGNQNAGSPTQSALGIPFPDVVRVTLDDAKKAYDAKSAVFVDVRDAASYAESHISGAINIPLDQIKSRLAELDPQSWIITYCT